MGGSGEANGIYCFTDKRNRDVLWIRNHWMCLRSATSPNPDQIVYWTLDFVDISRQLHQQAAAGNGCAMQQSQRWLQMGGTTKRP